MRLSPDTQRLSRLPRRPCSPLQFLCVGCCFALTRCRCRQGVRHATPGPNTRNNDPDCQPSLLSQPPAASTSPGADATVKGMTSEQNRYQGGNAYKKGRLKTSKDGKKQLGACACGGRAGGEGPGREAGRVKAKPQTARLSKKGW